MYIVTIPSKCSSSQYCKDQPLTRRMGDLRGSQRNYFLPHFSPRGVIQEESQQRALSEPQPSQNLTLVPGQFQQKSGLLQRKWEVGDSLLADNGCFLGQFRHSSLRRWLLMANICLGLFSEVPRIFKLHSYVCVTGEINGGMWQSQESHKHPCLSMRQERLMRMVGGNYVTQHHVLTVKTQSFPEPFKFSASLSTPSYLMSQD